MKKAMTPGGDGDRFTYFEYENARFRRPVGDPSMSVSDVLHGDKWVPYQGDRLAPGMFGNEISNPTADAE